MAKAQLNAGMTLDGFVLQERLHRGGMAAIWSVTHPDIDFPIVMKVPFLDYEGDLSLLIGFEVEQMIMAELKGIHVPKLVANGAFTVQPYIVMEYIAGATLQKRMGGEVIPLDELTALAASIADALGDLHQQHVLHLDLKPANILFRPTGEAVIIDFGLSRHEKLPDLLDEQFHKPTGTTEYMAPEQLLMIRSDKRSDIFALGAMLYQLATGELPFGAPSKIKYVRQRVWRDPVPPRKLRPEISPALQEIILKCIDPMPENRFTNAEEMAFELRNLDLVEVTERGERLERSNFKTAFRKRMRVRKTMQAIQASATKPPPRAPIILVAIDLSDDLRQPLQEAAVAALANMPGARLACLNVMQTSLIAIDENVNEDGDNIHVNRMAELRTWAEPLQLPRGKVTFHLIESRNIPAGILEFAHSNKVDHIVVGAHAGSGPGASKNTMQIALEAPCTVTVVRLTEADRLAAAQG
ncbi:MAG: protein kinase [Hyphomicrobium sp.]|nr:protein kinase [Hyphomicrobium sp.]